MAGNAWTAGPWKQQVTEPPGQYVIHSMTALGPGKSQARTVGWTKTEADARVMAAAPELAEACAAFVAYDEADQASDVALMLAYADALKLAKAALRKARGDQPDSDPPIPHSQTHGA